MNQRINEIELIGQTFGLLVSRELGEILRTQFWFAVYALVVGFTKDVTLVFAQVTQSLVGAWL